MFDIHIKRVLICFFTFEKKNNTKNIDKANFLCFIKNIKEVGMEKIDLYDENKVLTGEQITRGEPIALGQLIFCSYNINIRLIYSQNLRIFLTTITIYLIFFNYFKVFRKN